MVRGERAWVPVTDKIPRPWPHSPWQLVTVVLGAHDLQSQEPEQQKFTIVQVFQNNYNPEENLNDVLLIQVGWPRGSTGSTSFMPCRGVSASAPAVRCAWLVAAVRVRVEATFWLLLGPWLMLGLWSETEPELGSGSGLGLTGRGVVQQSASSPETFPLHHTVRTDSSLQRVFPEELGLTTTKASKLSTELGIQLSFCLVFVF